MSRVVALCWRQLTRGARDETHSSEVVLLGQGCANGLRAGIEMDDECAIEVLVGDLCLCAEMLVALVERFLRDGVPIPFGSFAQEICERCCQVRVARDETFVEDAQPEKAAYMGG